MAILTNMGQAAARLAALQAKRQEVRAEWAAAKEVAAAAEAAWYKIDMEVQVALDVRDKLAAEITAANPPAPVAPQAIEMNGRTYTFTTEGAKPGAGITIVGSLFNSRGAFAGYVAHTMPSGGLVLLGGPKLALAIERRGLAQIKLPAPATA